MKKLSVFMILMFIANFAVAKYETQLYNILSNDSIIYEDSMNLAIIKIDFLTYEFEELNLSYYPLCDSCDLDSLPFTREFIYPMDFGEIEFKYSENQQLLFGGGIVWAGNGDIYYPESFTPASEFLYIQNAVPKPSFSQYFDYWLVPNYCTNEEYILRADTAWSVIDSLEIVNKFAEESFRVGFYAYTPNVGLLNLETIKWIIFLYRGTAFTVGQNENIGDRFGIKIFPNPTNGIMNINLLSYEKYDVCLLNIHGEKVRVLSNCSRDTRVDFTNLPQGLYFLHVKNPKHKFVRKIVIQ